MKLCIISSCLNENASIKDHLQYLNNLNNLFGTTYIICDGGSVDGSIETIESELASNCILIKNSGTIYNSWNQAIRIGLKIASHLVFLGVGDKLEPVYLRNTILQPNSNEADVIISQLKIGPTFRGLSSCQNFQKSLNSIFACMPAHHVGVIFSTRLFNQVGMFNTDFKIAADLDWMLRLRQIKTLKVISYPQFGVYMKPGGVSSGLQKPMNIMVEECKIAFLHKLAPCPKRILYLCCMILKHGLDRKITGDR